jgi:membrane-bound lytic murein transglycosylase B
LGVLGIGGLCAALGVTTWLVGASSSAGAEIEPIAGPPPSGALASPAALSRPAPRSERVRHSDTPRGTREVSLQEDYATWATGMSGLTGVPARALQAYAAANRRTELDDPSCHLDWTTLAGIGYVESLNGEDGGGLGPDGRPVSAIYGPSLDGSGQVASVSDSDGGAMDADPTLDRAVGPLQFLPSTWRTWGSDGDGDGVRDPQDVDDAALSAARYLCAAGDLRTPAGWTEAVFSYNHSAEYVQSVYTATDRIATSSRG